MQDRRKLIWTNRLSILPHKIISLGALVTVTLVASTVAHAQAPRTEGDKRTIRVIEEVIVTARKKSESIQDVPISISALGGEQLRNRGIENIHELAEMAPNVRFTTNACCTTVFIRGFGTPFAAGAFDPTVGIAIDELSLSREIYMSDPLFDIERFEILRGPQGTLFGKNTPAGLFNITTANPDGELSGFFIGKVGGKDVHRVEGAFGGPIGSWGEKARFRVAFVDSKQAGDVHNTALDLDEPATEQQGIRLKLAISPTDSLDIMLIGSRATTDSRYFHIQSDSFRPATVEFPRDYDPEFEDDPLDHQNSINEEEGVVRETDLLQMNIRWNFEDKGWLRQPEIVAIAGVTGFDQDSALDVDFSPADVLALDPSDFDYQQKSLELRFAGSLPGLFGVGDIEFLLGTQIVDADLQTRNHLIAGEDIDEYLLGPAGFELATGMPPVAGNGFADMTEVASAFGLAVPTTSLTGDGSIFFLDQKTISKSLFGRIAWNFLEVWSVSFGARLTEEKKDAHLFNHCFSPGFLCAALGLEEFDLELERNESDFSPKVTIQYYPLEDLSIFLTRAQGFKSGGFNNFSFTSDGIQVDAEKAVSWEAGVKGKLLSGALAYAATLFETTVDDLQLQNTRGTFVQVRNAASAESRGLELEGQWLTPWEPLSIRIAGAMTDGRFESFPNAPAVAGSGEDSQDLAGRRMPFVPKQQWTVSPELLFPIGDNSPFSLTIGADVLYRSDFYLDSDLDPHTLEESYTKIDGRIALTTEDGDFAVELFVSNLTDVDVREFNTDSLVYPGGYVAFQEFARNWALQLRLAW